MRKYLLAVLLGFGFASPSALAEQATNDEVAVSEPQTPQAARIVVTPELVEAHYAHQLALARWRQFRYRDMHRERRLLDDEVQLSRAEIRVLQRRLRDYQPFLQVGRHSPARTAAENDQLALLYTQQALRQQEDARLDQIRERRQTVQLLELEVLHAALKYRQVLAEAPRIVE